MIEVQKQIILAFTIWNTLSFPQVSRLKLRVKEDCLIINVMYKERLWWVCQLLRLKKWSDTTPSDRLPHELVYVLLYRKEKVRSAKERELAYQPC